jgi:hypothetical protein
MISGWSLECGALPMARPPKSPGQLPETTVIPSNAELGVSAAALGRCAALPVAADAGEAAAIVGRFRPLPDPPAR